RTGLSFSRSGANAMGKRSMKCVLATAVAGLMLAGVGASTAKAQYQWITLDTPNNTPTSNIGTDIYGITNSRVATGFDFTPAGPGSSGLIFHGTTGAVITAPSSTETELYQMNNAGQAAASYGDASGNLHAAIYNSG